MSKLFLGLDAGSTASKCVAVNDEGTMVANAIHPSGAGTLGPGKVVDEVLTQLGTTREGLFASCATGYGRKLQDWCTYQVSELTCHAKGSFALFGEVATVIDIGGQDAKVLTIGPGGALENFVMNDKCAAGTGRFLDVMASIFGCEVSELSALDEQSSAVAHISSTCTVFAESEVISKLAAGTPIPNIAAGVHVSVVERTCGLVRRAGLRQPVAMTGGVALNNSLRRHLEEALNCSIQASPLSQLNGALGAALIARERSLKGLGQ